jgi:autotransporter translocation and assembly factor TamB
VEAEANSVATSLRAVYTLGGDSIAIARGSLPARLTFSDGVVMNAELPMAGTLKLADRPWMFGYPLLPFGSTIGGRVSGELTVLGSPARPNWLGNLQCRDGSYRDTRYGLDYRAIGADLTLHRDTLFVEHLTLQSSGTLTGSGRILMSFPLPRQLDLDVNLANFEAVDSRNLKARLSGAVSVHGPLDSLHAAGKVRFSEGTYRITQATTKQIEEIDLTAELSRLRGDSTLRQGILVSRFYRPMSHALYVDIPGNVWLRGSGLNVELFGGIWMYKNAHEDPTLNGEIKVKRGTVDFAGHEFRTDQDSGAVVFRGPIDDPELNIIAIEQSILRTTGDQIRIRVFGTVQNSRIELSGTRADGGEMTLEEVLQRLFGAILPLAGGSGGDLQGTITTAGVSQLSGLVARAAGVDVFQFRPGTGGFSDLSGSSLEVGTYLTDRLYIRVLQPIESVQGNQDVLVEYRLFDWLKLAGHQFGTKSSEFKTVLQWEWR